MLPASAPTNPPISIIGPTFRRLQPEVISANESAVRLMRVVRSSAASAPTHAQSIPFSSS